MNPADIVILLLIGVSASIGLVRGFVKEVLSLVNWAAALAIALIFKAPLAAALPFPAETSEVVGQLVAALLLFFGTLVSGALLVHALGEFVKATGLSGTDRTLGLCFGLTRGLVIVMAGLIFIPALVPVDETGWWNDSRIIPGFLQFESWVRDILSALFGWIQSLFS